MRNDPRIRKAAVPRTSAIQSATSGCESCGNDQPTPFVASAGRARTSSRWPPATVMSATPGPGHGRFLDRHCERQYVTSHDDDVEQNERAEDEALSGCPHLSRNDRAQS